MFAELRKLSFETAVYGISTVLTRLINFLLIPLYTHYLTPDDYGRVASVFSLIAFLNVFYVIGLSHGYMRFKNKDNLSSIFSFINIWAFLLSIFVMFFSNIFSAILGLEKVYNRLIYYAAMILYLDAVTTIPLTDLRMEHRAISFVAIRSFSIVINVILNFVFLKYTNLSIDGIFYAAIISSFSQFVFLKNYLSYFTLSFDISSMRKVFSYSLPYVGSSLSSVSIQLFDRPLMMHFLSPYYVGLYQANFRLAVFMNLVVSMFDFAWRPFVIERMKLNNAKEIFKKIFEYFSFFLIYLFFILSLIIEDIVKLNISGIYIINPNYWSGIKIIPMIMLGYLFLGFYTFFMIGSIITEKSIYSMKANIFSSIVSILMNLILIPFFGIYGAAISFVFANMFLAFYMYYINEFRLWQVGYNLKKPLFLLLITILIIFLIDRYAIYECLKIQVKFFLILTYPFFAGLFGYFQKDDINVFRSKLKKVFK
ncbi:MAG: oligosaccharide flippase family protein [Elusimicrobiales bacterium]|nr:oligosaccharide flippase family protein [Elusimicrobiales bacterium]